MADKIRWDSAAVEACINEYKAAKATLESCRDSYSNQISLLNSVWEGKASRAFDGKAAAACVNISSSIARVDDAMEDLKALNQTFAEGEGQVTAMAGSLDGGHTVNPFTA